ncbi:toprim domain-containing protein, partial [Parabacteroides merdae]
RQQASEPSFQHLEVGELTHPALLRYLQERGINIALAKAQCKELHFTHNGKPYFAIGFPNVAGGFEVRNRFFKGCVAPKDISHIRQQGEAREKCLVFEGMMDYLSFLTLRKRNCSNLPDLDRQDYVILNSTANVSKAIDVLHGYGRIHCMLDNDEAGRKAYRELERKFAGRIRDFSDNYKGHKDLNDYLRGIRQKLAVSPPPRTIVKPKKKGLGL